MSYIASLPYRFFVLNCWEKGNVSFRINWMFERVVIIVFSIFSMVKIQSKLDKASQCLEYFMRLEWRFYNDNIKELNLISSNEDR